MILPHRCYDSRIGRRWNIDPVVKEWESPYMCFGDNPISSSDVLGNDAKWIPGTDSKGNITLTAEKGDNTKTLKKFFGNDKNAKQYLSNEQMKGAKNYKEGETVTLKGDNPYSKALKDAKERPESFFYNNNHDKAPDNYNCHSAAIHGSQGDEFHKKVEEMSIDDRNKILEEKYHTVLPKDVIFGKTIITFGIFHSAVYFGTSKNGTVYVFSKGGNYEVPIIMVVNAYTGRDNTEAYQGSAYGPVQNPTGNLGECCSPTDNFGRLIMRTSIPRLFNKPKTIQYTPPSSNSAGLFNPN